MASAVAALGVSAAAVGWLPAWAGAAAAAWVAGITVVRVSRGSAGEIDPTAVQRGAVLDACAWLVDVPPGRENDALALATTLRRAGARGTFFVAAADGELAAALVDLRQQVGWLGAPGTAREDGKPLPPGTILVGRPNPRARLWRPIAQVPTDGERQMAHTCGLRRVMPTMTLPTAPTGLTPVGTDLVLVPLPLSASAVTDWLEDLDRRAIRVAGIG